MMYFDLNCVRDAYSNFQGKLTNKSWGLLCVMKQLDGTIVPGKTYTFNGKSLSEYIENLFCLSTGKTTYKDNDWYVKFSTQWYDFFKQQSKNVKPNVFDTIVWAYRKESFLYSRSDLEWIQKFAEDFHIEYSLIPSIFDITPRKLSYATNLYTDAALNVAIFGKSAFYNITAEKHQQKEPVGELKRGPFLKPLYGAQDTPAFFLISQVDFDKMYPFNGGKASNPSVKNLLIQQIFYGAPGTGKSHTINEKTQGHDVIRTTFHPDSDYSTFVGAYKPKMGDPKPIYGFDSKGKTVKVVDSAGNDIPERKIEYKFVKQAFLKAYIAAWKKIGCHKPYTRGISFSIGTAIYTILSVDDKGLQQSKTDQINKNSVERTWEKLWSSGSFKIPTGKQSGTSIQQAISKWIVDNIEKCKINNFNDGWEKLTNQLKEKEIEISKDVGKHSQIYTLSCSENKNCVLFSAKSPNTKDRIQKCYEGYDEATGVEKGIIDILNGYDTNNFDDAWTKLCEEVENNNLIEDTVAPQFLIIEEINRGNCAQIFGDIFQLLDRNCYNYSEYPIEADEDIRKSLISKDSIDDPSFGIKGLQLTKEQKDYIDKMYDKPDSPTQNVAEKICNGKVLVLPPNLYIWATMNTSDQSLFPMDSAFKRRWDWECVPIDYKNEKSKNFTITIDGKRYNWHDFLEKVNNKILKATGSEDKQMGNFFIKGDVDEKQFINKVMFYLWNDVCKEEYGTQNNFFRYYKDSEKKETKETEEFTFNKLFEGKNKDTFSEEAKGTLANFMVFLGVDDEETKKKKSEAEKADVPSEPETVPVL